MLLAPEFRDAMEVLGPRDAMKVMGAREAMEVPGARKALESTGWRDCGARRAGAENVYHGKEAGDCHHNRHIREGKVLTATGSHGREDNRDKHLSPVLRSKHK